MLIGGIFCLQLYCSSGTDPQGEPVLNGTVIDQQGNPVSGALIELEYHPALGKVHVAHAQQHQVNAVIRFNIPEAGAVRVWITRYGGSDTVRVLMDEFAMAGNYMLIWDGKNETGQRVINHIYQNHVLYKGMDTTGNILVTYDYYNEVNPDNLEYITLSDASGNFTIPAEELACMLDVEVDITDELGNKLGTASLSRQIKVWALHHAHGATASEILTFRTGGPTSVRLHY